MVTEIAKKVYTIPEVATMLNISTDNAYKQNKAGSIPAIKVGRLWIIPISRFDAWLHGKNIEKGVMA